MTPLQELLKRLPPLEINQHRTVQQLQKFTLFPSLPFEIQNMIWGYAAKNPRLVKLYDSNLVNLQLMSPRFKGQDAVPPLLHACSHARTEGLRHYEKCYYEKLVEKEIEPQRRRRRSELGRKPLATKMIYVNFEVDRFVYTSNLWYPVDLKNLNLPLKVVERIKHIAYFEHETRFFGLQKEAERLAKNFAICNLKDVTVIVLNWQDKGKGESVEGDLIRGKLRSLFPRIKGTDLLRLSWDPKKTAMPVYILWEAIDDVDLTAWYTVWDSAARDNWFCTRDLFMGWGEREKGQGI